MIANRGRYGNEEQKPIKNEIKPKSKLRVTRATEITPKPELIIKQSLKKPKNSRNIESASDCLKTTCTPKLYPETLPDIPYYTNNTDLL